MNFGEVMVKILKPLLIIFFCLVPFYQVLAENKEENVSIVEIRQQAMQAMWQRLDRLSTLIARPGDIVASSDGTSIVIGNKETQTADTYALIQGREAIQDATEVAELLKQVKDLLVKQM